MAKATATKTGTAIAVPPESFASTLAIVRGNPADILAPIRDNLAGQAITDRDLDRIKIPAGGGKAWELPSLDGDGGTSPTIDGVVVFTKIVRAFWPGSIDAEGNQPPACRSDDGTNGRGNPGGVCASCPMNQWPEGEDAGRKPCKEMRLLFMVRGEDILPTVVVLPPTSLGAFKTYLLRLASRGLSYHQVVTRLGLEPAQNDKGIKYSKAVPSLVERLDNDTHAKIKAYGETLATLFAQAGVQSSDA